MFSLKRFWVLATMFLLATSAVFAQVNRGTNHRHRLRTKAALSFLTWRLQSPTLEPESQIT